MEYINWKEFLIPYTYAVEELKIKFKNVRKELRDKTQYSPIEFVTGRVKKISSIIDKANRLGVKFTEYDLSEGIEDIAGIRIMCQFVEDIYTVVDFISAREDMSIVYEKDYVKNFKESGYRSYHVILRYPLQTVSGVKNILAEVQLRTLSMNFWATIEHSLKYKYNHKLPLYISEKLRSSADAAFKLDEQMGQIKEEIVNSQKIFEKKSYLVEEIFDLIQMLVRQDNGEKIKYYLNKFNELNNTNDIESLILLRKELYSYLDEN